MLPLQPSAALGTLQHPASLVVQVSMAASQTDVKPQPADPGSAARDVLPGSPARLGSDLQLEQPSQDELAQDAWAAQPSAEDEASAQLPMAEAHVGSPGQRTAQDKSAPQQAIASSQHAQQQQRQQMQAPHGNADQAVQRSAGQQSTPSAPRPCAVQQIDMRSEQAQGSATMIPAGFR